MEILKKSILKTVLIATTSINVMCKIIKNLLKQKKKNRRSNENHTAQTGELSQEHHGDS